MINDLSNFRKNGYVIISGNLLLILIFRTFRKKFDKDNFFLDINFFQLTGNIIFVVYFFN